MQTKLKLLMSTLLATTLAAAQSSTNSAGFEATGEGGKISASIGQPFFNESSNGEFALQEGVQQAYIITPSFIHDVALGIDLQVYPNPTMERLTLKINSGFRDELNYEFTDMQGKLLLFGKLSNTQTEIDTDRFAAGTYTLRISELGNSVNTFKIVKQ